MSIYIYMRTLPNAARWPCSTRRRVAPRVHDPLVGGQRSNNDDNNNNSNDDNNNDDDNSNNNSDDKNKKKRPK